MPTAHTSEDRRIELDMLSRRNTTSCGFLHVGALGIDIPATIICGTQPGKTLLVTAGIHGAEYAGIAAVRTLAQEIVPSDLSGNLLFLHCCNPGAFYGHVRATMPEDGENLNRAFPPIANGTHTHAVARYLDYVVTEYADYHIDVHSGDAAEALHPHCYYSGTTYTAEHVAAASKAMAVHSGMPYMVLSNGTRNVFQHSCIRTVPAVLMEMGQQGIWSEKESSLYAEKIKNVMRHLGIMAGDTSFTQPVDITQSEYIDSAYDGCWHSSVKVGEKIVASQKLGHIEDFFGNTLDEIYAHHDGVVLYMASSLSIRTREALIAYGRPTNQGKSEK